MGFWDAVASGGPYANNLPHVPDNTLSLNFCIPDALRDAQPTVSKHSPKGNMNRDSGSSRVSYVWDSLLSDVLNWKSVLMKAADQRPKRGRDKCVWSC